MSESIKHIQKDNNY